MEPSTASSLPAGAVRDSVTIVVVTYNSAGNLPGFFASLPSALEGVSEAEIVIVDNASADNSVAVARESWPGVTIVELPDNRGYAAGINAGVAAARPSSAVLVSNDDIRFRRGSIRSLLDSLRPPEVGIAVPRLIDGDGHLLHSLRRSPTVLRALGEAALGGRLAGRLPLLSEVITDPDAYQRETYAAWASGCALLISAECWNATGPWDESLFLYAEDIEYAQRAARHQHRIRLDPAAEAVHLVGPSRRNPRLWAMSVWNRYRVYRRTHGLVASTAYRIALFLNEALRALAGRRIHRAGAAALLFASRRPEEVR